jgi:hypothetical protein
MAIWLGFVPADVCYAASIGTARAYSKRNAGPGGGNKASKFKQMAPADEGVLSDADR